MGLSQEEVLHIARLARVGLSLEDVERMREQLSSILEHFEVLQELDTSEVPPTAYVIPLQNVFREDQSAPSLTQGEVLANAPSLDENCFRVQPVLEE